MTEQTGGIVVSENTLRAAKIGLVAALNHQFDTCNSGDYQACFVCEGLYGVVSALGERWDRADGRRAQSGRSC